MYIERRAYRSPFFIYKYYISESIYKEYRSSRRVLGAVFQSKVLKGG